MTVETPIPTIVIDDTAIKRRGVCEFVEETSLLHLYAQAGDAPETLQLVENISEQHPHNKDLAAWLVLSDLRLGNGNGVDLGRALLEIAPGLRIVIYTQEPSWTLAFERLGQAVLGPFLPRLIMNLLLLMTISILPALIVKRRNSHPQAERATEPVRN